MDANINDDDLCELNRNFMFEDISNNNRKMKNSKSAANNIVFAELIKNSPDVFINFKPNFFSCNSNTVGITEGWSITIIHTIHKKVTARFQTTTWEFLSLISLVNSLHQQ